MFGALPFPVVPVPAVFPNRLPPLDDDPAALLVFGKFIARVVDLTSDALTCQYW
jgi:hypothetical protein